MCDMTKKSVMKVVAAIGKKSAEIGCNSASIFGFHQPKEPYNLSNELRKELAKFQSPKSS